MNLKTSRILITGGAGFLGSAIQKVLNDSGVPAKNIFIPRKARYDLTTQEAAYRVYGDSKPDVVIHLAAEVGGIGANQQNPGRYFYANMAMGINMIEFARHFRVKKFVQLGTVCGYPKFTPVPFSENNLWSGYPEETNSPYGIAKRSLLTMCQAYREQYGLNAIYLLPTNLYGPNDNFDLKTSHVIPALIRKFVLAKRDKQEHVWCWGDGSPSREFLYVDDCAKGIIDATIKYDKPDPINLGSGEEIKIKDLVNLTAELVGYDGTIHWDETKPNGQPRRCLDVNRAHEEFGFRANMTLKEGLKHTIDWFYKFGHNARGIRPERIINL